MNCPDCGTPDADPVTANFWVCKNGKCQNAGTSALKKKRATEYFLDYDNLWRVVVAADYGCIKCLNTVEALVHEVAAGKGCDCGGALVRLS